MSVVLPESMWAEMPMLRSFARSFMDVAAGKGRIGNGRDSSAAAERLPRIATIP